MVRVAVAQIRVTDSVDKNLKTILNFIDKATRKKADIVCFPEICLNYDENKVLNLHPYIQQIQEKCKQKSIYSIFGSYVKINEQEFCGL